jgi:hypothetical protein
MVLVDHAPCGSLVGRGQGLGRFDDRIVRQRTERIAGMRVDHAEQQDEQLALCLGEHAERGEHQPQIALLLPLLDGRRVLPRRVQIHAVVGAGQFDQAFRSTADRTDRPAGCRAGTPSRPPAAERALHEDNLGAAQAKRDSQGGRSDCRARAKPL